MTMIDYINAVKVQLHVKYGFDLVMTAGGDTRIAGDVPDGVYPMTINDRKDKVKIVGGKIHCCNWE